jgi:tRNA (guanine10-N2)-dimethyltransferase
MSGEHKTLPISEVEAILKAESFEYQILEELTQILRFESDVKCVELVRLRSALTRVCCQEIFECKADISIILSNLDSINFQKYIGINEKFVVRVRRVKGSTPELSRVDLESKIGEKILENTQKAIVDLVNPQKTFFGVLTDKRFFFGLKIAEIIPKPFTERRPRKRPFFHPTAMPAKLARVMVNLAQPKRDNLVLDPFCGTGGILVEAGLIGCRTIGFEAKSLMLKGGLRNLNYYDVKLEGVVRADARNPPVTKIDCITTDPPYGRSASTLGTSTKNIVYDFLCAIKDKLSEGGKICMASPKTIQIAKIATKLGFKHLESHFVYVHRSLTREIVVFEKI